MGQQQLLLLILVFIVVGIATFVAIEVFEDSLMNGNRDAIQQDMIAAIGKAQKYYHMPSGMGGGGESFNGITLENVQLDSTNLNGSYEISGSGSTLEIIGTGVRTGVKVRATATINADNRVSVAWEDI